MKIGLVDLDTSHPPSWIPILREMGHEIVGVFDSGNVHPSGFAQEFATKHQIPRVYESPAQMSRDVDCAILHGCNWDAHVDLAEPFIAARKAILIDKPIAGKSRDLKRLAEWAQNGARITGGSALRFCDETTSWLAKPQAERGLPHTVLCGCGVDEFNYGIHAYAMLVGLIGCGAKSVRHLADAPQRRIEVRYDDGRVGIVVVGATPKWIPFYASIATDRGCHSFVADPSKLYRPLLERALPYLSGSTDVPPVPFDDLIEPERLALAARLSWMQNDRAVSLVELSDDAVGYDGDAFARSYRRRKYPQST